MRIARHALTALTLGALALGLGACSGDDAGTDDDATSTAAADGLEGSIPTSGWWCRMIKEDSVAVATDGRQAEAREVLRQNDESGHLCEVVLPVEEDSTETETVMAFQIQADAEDAAEQIRSEMAGRDDAEPGPDYLGESYVVPGAAYAIVPCGAPVGSPDEGQQVPYVLSVTTTTEAGKELTDALTEPLRRSLIELDQSVKCSPKAAHEEVVGDDAGATTAP
ncbi:hypothetical protein [Ornithinicoccus hortensis]|uniref:Uncharacterized protein n=1 Tax=Ornithinicoccus hortensis TaxID=82346 RepID=A0A542YVX3_9MICO|nr:hypothetical protein [Ornithinicoccus hortensis]TQL52225.1 hypothetical protein FB467_3404 [Ornithinicoccus hortensis]